ncbi:YqaJ viral recombinase family protein [Mycoplasmopsis ciconiae]|uniref:YqaJ viral recombinase family protein n=1 Tax=Mycoplasmopsis ciconiae TaxID=561067 RepID=A0ABU7MKV7_9BACT|nr:YqaJ viral recombinase family protein [Mycoplasmopsis ciconiae]
MAKAIERKYFNNVHYILDEDKRVVILKNEFHNELLGDNKWTSFKKIGGSTIAEVLETDSFKSQFSAFCHIARLKMPVLQKKYVNAGVAIEPKIFSAFSKEITNAYGNKFLVKHFEAADYDYDFFKGKDKVFGGVPDGELVNTKNPLLNQVLEAKTVNFSKYTSWIQQNDKGEFINVPVAYKKQAQLYAHLMNLKKYIIIATFLEDDKGDYVNPQDYPILERKNYTFSFNVNPHEVEEDINTVRKWYKKYTETGVSPQYNPSIDKDQVEYLRCSSQKEWEELLNKWKAIGKADADA